MSNISILGAHFILGCTFFSLSLSFYFSIFRQFLLLFLEFVYFLFTISFAVYTCFYFAFQRKHSCGPPKLYVSQKMVLNMVTDKRHLNIEWTWTWIDWTMNIENFFYSHFQWSLVTLHCMCLCNSFFYCCCFFLCLFFNLEKKLS